MPALKKLGQRTSRFPRCYREPHLKSNPKTESTVHSNSNSDFDLTPDLNPNSQADPDADPIINPDPETIHYPVQLLVRILI